MERVAQMARAALSHLYGPDHEAGPRGATADGSTTLTLDDILSNIQYYRVHDYVQLIAVVEGLDDLCRKLGNVSLREVGVCCSRVRHACGSVSLGAPWKQALDSPYELQ